MARGRSLPVVLLVLSLIAVGGITASAAAPVASVLTDTPEVSLDVDPARDAGPAEASATVVFTHAGGDAVPMEKLRVVVEGDRVADRENLTLRRSAATFGIGERLVVAQTGPSGLTGGEELTLVYQHGDAAFRLRTVTVPE